MLYPHTFIILQSSSCLLLDKCALHSGSKTTFLISADVCHAVWPGWKQTEQEMEGKAMRQGVVGQQTLGKGLRAFYWVRQFRNYRGTMMKKTQVKGSGTPHKHALWIWNHLHTLTCDSPASMLQLLTHTHTRIHTQTCTHTHTHIQTPL